MSTARPIPDDSGAASTDVQLVRRVLDGDREAFSILVTRHQHALFRYARSMGVSREVAQDLMQDTFVRAYTRLRQCHDGARFRAWSISILRNLLIDNARSSRNRELPLDAATDSPSRYAVGDYELRSAIAQALAALPDALREAFLLRHHHGYSYEDIAAITGARLSAVKMRVHRAREQLKAALIHEST